MTCAYNSELAIFFVYLYLDPEKPGKFRYVDFCFDYEPFYVGKGKGARDTNRLLRVEQNRIKERSFLVNKLKSIYTKGLLPICLRLFDKLSEKEAFENETLLIRLIGRRDLKKGPLTNLTDGGDGVSGIIFSLEEKSRISERLRRNNPCSHKNMSMQQITEKNRKSGDTTKLRGSLKGENHPLYDVGHTDESRLKIKLNHARCDGEFNSHAKRWVIISPENEMFNVHGNLKGFCKSHNLPLMSFQRRVNKGKIVDGKGSTLCLNGWELRYDVSNG
jgi:hypothetical protein